MTQRGTLTDLLCNLYRYSKHLAAQLDQLVRTEAAETARARGEPDDYVRLLADPPELFRRLTEADQNIARDDGRHRIDLVEAKDRVVGQLRKAGKPAGESRAWRHAVHWLGDRLPGVRRSRIEPCLQRYCEFKLIDRAPPPEQVGQLGLATAAWPGGAIKGRAILMHAARGGQSNALVPDERDKLWSQEGDEASESAYRELVAGIVDLDGQGKGDELLREIWELHANEVTDAGLGNTTDRNDRATSHLVPSASPTTSVWTGPGWEATNAPTLFELLSTFYAELRGWERQHEADAYQVGAGIELAELRSLLNSSDPPPHVAEAIRENRVERLEDMLRRIHAGELSKDEALTEFGAAATVPSYAASRADARLVEDKPDYFAMQQAWHLIVQGIIDRFTISWEHPLRTFEASLRNYIECRQPPDPRLRAPISTALLKLRSPNKPDEFSAELAKLNSKGTGGEIFGRLEREFRTIAAGLKLSDCVTGKPSADRYVSTPGGRLLAILDRLQDDEIKRECAWLTALEQRMEIVAKRFGWPPESLSHPDLAEAGNTEPKEPGPCQRRAATELQVEHAAEWSRWGRSPWKFAMDRMFDHACTYNDPDGRFATLKSFATALEGAVMATRLGRPVAVAVVRRFLLEQDQNGTTLNLLAELWRKFPEDCETMGLEAPLGSPLGLPAVARRTGKKRKQPAEKPKVAPRPGAAGRRSHRERVVPLFQGSTDDVSKYLQCSTQSVRNWQRGQKATKTPDGTAVLITKVRNGFYTLVPTGAQPTKSKK